MYIVRWLMGHPIIATWALGLIAILLSMDAANKTYHNTEGTVSHVVKEVNDTDRAEIHSKDKNAPEGSVENDQHGVANVSEESSEMLEDDKSRDEKAIVDEKVEPVVKTVTEAPLVGGVPVADKNLVSEEKNLLESESKTEDESSDQEEPVAKAPSLTEETSPDLSQVNSSEILLMAREAYWNNGLDEAAELYIQLIKREPNIIEYKGELGNVYWRQGYPKKAAELYSEIALPMIRKGGSDRVANMVGFIGLFYPDRAADIHQQILLMQNGN